jgi:hypothetical protein
LDQDPRPTPIRAVRPRAIRLDLVTASEARGFIVPASSDGAPAFRGHWSFDYVCGRCERVLCEGVRPGLFYDVVFQCRQCGRLNRVPHDLTQRAAH